MNNNYDKFIIIGYIKSSYGILGYNKIISYTNPFENIFNYKPWFLKYKKYFKKIFFKNKKIYKKNIFILKFENSNNRNDSDLFLKKNIFIKEKSLPILKNEFYWKDLIKCNIIFKKKNIGKVINIFNNKIYDILIIYLFNKNKNYEIFIPFLIGKFIDYINIEKKEIYILNNDLLNIQNIFYE